MALFSPGLLLAQRYRLEALIGSGGMSQVWRAYDMVLGRAVAIKTVDGPAAADTEMRAAIRREARAVARISHPNVTQVFDYGEEAVAFGVAGPGHEVTPYLVMELIDGESLADRLTEGPLPAAQAMRVAADVAAALTAAHRLGVVHRDIKPGNVMLTSAGAKVVDFGIAVVAEGTAQPTGPAHAGTPDYVAPEVLMGRSASAASDVYGLGVLLHVMLTGVRPPAGLADLPGVPAELAAPLRRCLAPAPEDRPSSDELVELLTPGAGEAERRPARARPTGVAAVRAHPAPSHTMIDARATPAPPAAYGPPDAPAALVRRRRPLSALLIGLTAAVVGLVLIGAAMMGGQPGAADGAAGAGQTTAATPGAPPTTDPATPDQLLAAMENAIIAAANAEQIDEGTARDLLKQVDDLRERIERRGGNDLRKKVEDIRDKIADKVEDDEFDPAVADQLNDLLDTLVNLVPPGGARDGDGDS